MKILAASFLILTSALATAGESPVIDTRLARIVEGAASETGFNINISQSTLLSVNIDSINGKNVCDKAAIEDVRKFQDAIAKQKDVKNNFGPAYYSVPITDGSHKILSPEQLIKQGIVSGCTDIYVSVAER